MASIALHAVYLNLVQSKKAKAAAIFEQASGRDDGLHHPAQAGCPETHWYASRNVAMLVPTPMAELMARRIATLTLLIGT